MTTSKYSQLSKWRTVLFALFLREWQSKFNDKFGLGWAFVEPFLFVFAMAYVRSLIQDSGEVHTVPIFVFMMVGLISVQSFLLGLSTIATASKKNKPLFAFRQVVPFSAFLTSFFVEFSIKLGVIVLSTITIYLIKIDVSVDNILLAIVMFICLWLFTFGIGVIFGIAEAFVPEVKKVQSLLSRPIFFISGIFFSLQDFPPSVWPYLNWNPILHFVEITRYAFYESYGLHGVSISFALISTLASVFTAMSLYQLTWKSVLSR